MKAKSLSALFATLSPSPRTVFGIQSVLSKHLENQVTITLLGIMAVLLLRDQSQGCPHPGLPQFLDTRIVTRASHVPGDQAKGLILH